MAEVTVVDWSSKYTGERYVNGLDWTDWLDDQTISSVSAEVIEGDITIDDPVGTFFNGVYQYVWVSGGTEGVSLIECTIVTSENWTLKQRVRIEVYE